MAKSLKKYKKPPRAARDPAEEVKTPPAQQKAMRELGIAPNMAPVKKVSWKPKDEVVISDGKNDEEDEARVDSGNEHGDGGFEERRLPSVAIPPKKNHGGGLEEMLPSAAIPPKKKNRKRSGKGAASQEPTDEVVETETVEVETFEDEGPIIPPIPPATQVFMTKWLPRWHEYCRKFPSHDNFHGVAPYCSAGIDLVLAFTHDVTASHISKKGLPFDVSPPRATPEEVEFNNVFYPADKIRNFIDINIRRFELFKAGEEMEGRMWVDMDVGYKRTVEALLVKVEKYRISGTWERESRRVNEMVKCGVFGKKAGEEDAAGSEAEV